MWVRISSIGPDRDPDVERAAVHKSSCAAIVCNECRDGARAARSPLRVRPGDPGPVASHSRSAGLGDFSQFGSGIGALVASASRCAARVRPCSREIMTRIPIDTDIRIGGPYASRALNRLRGSSLFRQCTLRGPATQGF